MRYYIIIILLFFLVDKLYAQHSGNVVYGDNSSIRIRPSGKKLFLTDSTFIIEANVLMNVIANDYAVTFAVSDSAVSVEKCNEQINKRTAGFIGKLVGLNIKPDEIYVDLIGQNKVLDYHVKDNRAEQYLKGFEIKKNITVKLSNIGLLDKLMIFASGFQIYDIVKIDYIGKDIEQINDRLFKLATEVINHKKELYVQATNAQLLSVSQIYAEDYSSYYPTQLYKTYMANNSGSVSSQYDRFVKKDLSNTVTAYYEKVNYSGIDKIVNPVITEPAIEFALTLQIKFQIKKVN